MSVSRYPDVFGVPLARARGSSAMDEMAEPLRLESLSIDPNNCRLEEPLHLNMQYSLERDLLDARWEIKVRPDAACPQLPHMPSDPFRDASSQFIADQASARKIVGELPCPAAALLVHSPSPGTYSRACRDTHPPAVLGETAPQDLCAGPHAMDFSVAEVSVSHLKRHVLANVGLLVAVLYAGEEEVVQVSMVTQVSPAADGSLMRSIYNPLD